MGQPFSAPKSPQKNSHTIFGRKGRGRAADGALRGYDAVAAGILPWKMNDDVILKSTLPFLGQERWSSIRRDLSVAIAAHVRLNEMATCQLEDGHHRGIYGAGQVLAAGKRSCWCFPAIKDRRLPWKRLVWTSRCVELLRASKKIGELPDFFRPRNYYTSSAHTGLDDNKVTVRVLALGVWGYVPESALATLRALGLQGDLARQLLRNLKVVCVKYELLPDQAEAGSRDHGSPRDLLAPPSKDGATRPPRRASDRAPTGTGRGVKRKTKESQGDKRRLERQCAPLDRTAGVTTSAPRRSEHDETGKTVRPASSSCTLEWVWYCQHNIRRWLAYQ